MKLFCFSDWRVQPIEEAYRFLHCMPEKPDLILYAGDDLHRFQEEGINHFSELARYTKQQRVLAVAGNDDFAEVKAVLNAENVHDLHESEYVLGDYVFLGLEGSTSGPGLLKHTEREVEEHLDKKMSAIKGKTLIVLSHAPPYGTLDLGIRFANPADSANHIGSKALKAFIEKANPAVVVCGHCHSQGRIFSNIGATKVVNIASHDSPGAVGNFALVEIDKTGLAEVSFYTTEELIPPDSLLNVHGVGASTEKALSQAGITTIDKLLEAPDLYKVADSSGIPFATIARTRAKAKAFKEGRPFKLKNIPHITGKLVFFDIETDVACERVWLIGVYDGKEFRRFYADTWEDEHTVLANFLRYLKLHSNATLVSFSGTNFDRNVVENALRRHRMDYPSFLKVRHIDLALQVKDCFIFPNQSYALKDLGAHLGYKFKHQELSGLIVALEYHRHVMDKTSLDPVFFEYNEDDVKVLPFMVGRLESLNEAHKSSSIAEIAITDKQKAFREFVEALKEQGVTGADYREKIAEWNREHK